MLLAKQQPRFVVLIKLFIFKESCITAEVTVAEVTTMETPETTGPSIASDYKACKCHVCTKSYSREDNLAHHMRQHNSVDIKCSHCKQRFWDAVELWRYSETKHLGKRFHCSICAEEFAHKGNLTYHERQHDNSIRFKCNFCKQGVNHMNALTLMATFTMGCVQILAAGARRHSATKPTGYSMNRHAQHQPFSSAVHVETTLLANWLQDKI